MKDRSTIHVEPGEGRAWWVSCELVTCKVTSEQTRGAYSLFEITSPPQSRVPPHIQHREDECFYVLEGEFEFLVEDRTMRVGAGSLVSILRGKLHAHENVGNGTGRLLVVLTPGGLQEHFFEEVGELATDGATPPAVEGLPDLTRIAKLAAGYGIEIPSTPRSRFETRIQDGRGANPGMNASTYPVAGGLAPDPTVRRGRVFRRC